MKASKLLEQSATPFDKACMQVKDLEECVERAQVFYDDIINNRLLITRNTDNFNKLGILLTKIKNSENWCEGCSPDNCSGGCDIDILDVTNYGGSSSEEELPEDKTTCSPCGHDLIIHPNYLNVPLYKCTKCDHIQSDNYPRKHRFKYDGHGHNYDVYKCIGCGHEEHR